MTAYSVQLARRRWPHEARGYGKQHMVRANSTAHMIQRALFALISLTPTEC
jgi:hypothetical protein